MIVNYPIGDANLTAAAVDQCIGPDKMFFESTRIWDQFKNRSRLEGDLDRSVESLGFRGLGKLVRIKGRIIGKRKYLTGSRSNYYDLTAASAGRTNRLGTLPGPLATTA